MRISSSLVSLALYLGFAAAAVVPDVSGIISRSQRLGTSFDISNIPSEIDDVFHVDFSLNGVSINHDESFNCTPSDIVNTLSGETDNGTITQVASSVSGDSTNNGIHNGVAVNGKLAK